MECCVSMVPLHLKDPFELVVKRMEFLHGYGFPSCCYLTYAIANDIKNKYSSFSNMEKLLTLG